MDDESNQVQITEPEDQQDLPYDDEGVYVGEPLEEAPKFGASMASILSAYDEGTDFAVDGLTDKTRMFTDEAGEFKEMDGTITPPQILAE